MIKSKPSWKTRLIRLVLNQRKGFSRIGWAKFAARFTAIIYSWIQSATVLGCQDYK